MRPPPLAEWLLASFAPKRIREGLLGDLQEEYLRFAVPELGLARARRWYWRQVLGVVSQYGPQRRLARAVSRRSRDAVAACRRSMIRSRIVWLLAGSTTAGGVLFVGATDARLHARAYHLVRAAGPTWLPHARIEHWLEQRSREPRQLPPARGGRSMRVPAVTSDGVATTRLVRADQLFDAWRAPLRDDRVWQNW